MRVKQVAPAEHVHAGCSPDSRCNHCSDKIWLEIKHLSMPRNEQGLRVRHVGKAELVSSHPWRTKGYSELAGLTNPRERH